MNREPYTDFQSMNWIPLSKNEFLLVIVNYCFVDKSWIDRDLFEQGIREQIESRKMCTDYVVTQFRLWKNGNKDFTENDKSIVEAYLKEFEKQQRLKNWG